MKLTRLLGALMALLLMASCGGRQQPQPLRSLPVARSISLPRAIPAVPAFRIQLDKPMKRPLLKQLLHIRGVAAAVPFSRNRIDVSTPDSTRRLRVGAVSPLEYRSVAPEPTSAADFVWTALMNGEAVMTPAAAEHLKVEGASVLRLNDDVSIAVGAFADNAVPNVADILIPEHVARDLRLGGARLVFVGTKPRADIDKTRGLLKRILPRARIRRLAPSAPAPQPQPIGRAEGGVIGAMTYRILKNGFIVPDPEWVATNIVTADVPILGGVICHRLLVPQLAAALSEIDRKGLARLIDRTEYGGCYVPRFIGRDPRRGLSMHAFGLAVDLNVSGNHFGTSGNLDARVVRTFEKWGFAWGGRWSPPDPMHFELARLLQT